jgi:phosphoesterase RecJ-like protein
VVFFKEIGQNEWRVSLRSKDAIDVNAVAKTFGGGGHKNASGCTAHGSRAGLTEGFQRALTDAIERAAN